MMRKNNPHQSVISIGLAFLLLACDSSSHAQSAADKLAKSQRGLTSQNAEVTAVVDRYWSASEGVRYGLLSESYKTRLRNLGITNGMEYDKATFAPERVWGRRTVQQTEIREDRTGQAQVVVLVEWEQEGYQGVMTFIFDFVREGGMWKIDFIMH